MKYLLIGCLLGLAACGHNGYNGQSIQGPAGTPGTVITMVQFCAADTTVYPNTFAEVGFCVDGKVYGTYSANGGFSTLLPPGTYNSNGINASCTFTIGENCQVTP